MKTQEQLGYTLKDAMVRRSKYKVMYLSCLVSTKELHSRVRKYKIGSTEVMRRIVHGEIPPMKRVKIT